jgi:hypothetical protein
MVVLRWHLPRRSDANEIMPKELTAMRKSPGEGVKSFGIFNLKKKGKVLMTSPFSQTHWRDRR